MSIVDTYRFDNRVGPDRRPDWIVQAVDSGQVHFTQPRNAPAYLTLANGARADVDDVVALRGDGSVTLLRHTWVELHNVNPYTREVPPDPDPVPEDGERYDEWVIDGRPPSHARTEFVTHTRLIEPHEKPATCAAPVYITDDVRLHMVEPGVAVYQFEMGLGVEGAVGLVLVHNAVRNRPDLLIEHAVQPLRKPVNQTIAFEIRVHESQVHDVLRDALCRYTVCFVSPDGDTLRYADVTVYARNADEATDLASVGLQRGTLHATWRTARDPVRVRDIDANAFACGAQVHHHA